MSVHTMLLALAFAAVAAAAPQTDLVRHLPGYGTPKTPQYSGFLKVNDPQGEMYYHYWLATSSSPTAAEDPVVLWMNGGPGASSIGYGLFTENGPYHLDESSLANKTEPGVPDVYDNPTAWSTVANVVFLEHPPSVGYSYCAATGSPKNATCKWNDTTQAEASYAAVKEFFRSFPEFKDNDFFVTGESYGGMYVPTLVEQIHKKGGVNLKGFAIGNGIIGHKDTFPGEKGVRSKFLHNKAFVSEKLWQATEAACGDFQDPSKECEEMMQKVSDAAGPFYIYNVFDTCGGDQVAKPWQHTLAEYEGMARIGQPDSYPCGAQMATTTWINLPEVRKAIHVPSEDFYGHPFACEAGPWLKYDESRPDLLDIYPTISAAYRTLIYNGDFDGCVPYLHGEGWTSNLGFSVKEAWRPWMVNGQVGGYVTTYNHNNFTFATVKGAGHMVPQYKAREGLYLIKQFLRGLPL